jgi:hypothetical protein
MNNQSKKCNAWLPPGFGIRCEKATDPLCQARCFQCCQRGNGSLPETNYLRCKNPQHPPYQESELSKKWKQTQEKIKQSLWQYPYATVDIDKLSKPKLKHAICQDIQLLQEILPLENCLIPDEDDTEMWDSSSCEELEEAMDKISQILNHENGLKAKLDLWENYRETEAKEVDDV